MENENIIELTNVSKSFLIHHEKRNTLYEYFNSLKDRKHNDERLQVLDKISFNVKKGEMFGIIGLNGSGKTTLLRIISKIYVPDNGEVITKGKIIPFLGLGAGFNGELTARDNIILYGTILGFTKKEITKKINSIIKFAEVEKFLDTKLKKFSSGMSARLAFSIALQVDPDILIMDEVLSVGDVKFREKSFKAFMEFQKKGKTIVYVSHNVQEIKDLCNRAIFLHKGRILAEGNPSMVVEKYLETIKL